jgi:hypothetical protein
MMVNILPFVLGISYNQPKFGQYATWNLNAITFADNSTVNGLPCGLFVNINNTVYVSDYQNSRVQIWLEGNTTPTGIFSAGLNRTYGIFVSITDDVYVDNGAYNNRVDKWRMNATNSTIAMYVNGSCWGVFVDIYDNIYCSLGNFHQILKRSFNDDANKTTIIAGNGSNGLAPNMLNFPGGIFIDLKFNLYVADCLNNRIQVFQSGQLNGTTKAGSAANGTISLLYPSNVILDADGYLFISDTYHNRIVGSGPNGFRCIVGCSTGSGTTSSQLNTPWSISFDSYGNLFVADTFNSRIQKFFLETNSSSKCLLLYLNNSN